MNYPQYASSSKSSIQVIPNTDSQEFAITYDCPSLLANTDLYFDNIKTTISDGTSEIIYEYIMVCDSTRMRSFDMSFITLFGLAVLC